MEHLNILVTGGAGYIGSTTILALLESGYRVVVLDNLSTGMRSLVPEECAFYEGEVADQGLTQRILRDHEVQAIMHFAGSIVVPESVANPLLYYKNNTLASHSLIESAVRVGVEHFVFSSTAAIYGAPCVDVVTEDTLAHPINPYGASKLMTERMLADTSAAHSMNYAALRYFNVAGADPLLRTGQTNEGSTHLIKVAVEAALGLRDKVAVFGTDYPTRDGTCIRDYIHVSDLARAHVSALNWLVNNPGEDLVANCGYGLGLSVFEVLDSVDRVAGTNITRTFEGRRAGDPPALIANSALLKERCGWQPARVEIDLLVRDALAWERKRSAANW